jgi:hypothetical protein
MLDKKLKGGALYIALIICMVTGITLSIFILIAHFNLKAVSSQMSMTQLKLNLQSGFNLAQSSYFDKNDNNKWKQTYYNEDSIRIKKMQWGAFLFISSETKNKQQYLKQCGLFGVSSLQDTALLVTDKGKPISLSGKIGINANFYFPKAGFKPAFVEGRNFSMLTNFYSYFRPSTSTLPGLNKNFIRSVQNCSLDYNPALDSLIPELETNLTNRFSAKSILIHKNNLKLTNCNLSGNIKLICDNKVIIDKSATLDNILITANHVTIKKGFKGTLQVIATDSIIIEEDCILNYPSSLTVIRASLNDNRLKGIFIEERSKVSGSIICLSEAGTTTPKVFLKLNKDCEIYGLVYSSGYAQLQGEIYGSAICEKLIVKTKSGTYENHLMDCEIDPRKYGGSLVTAGIFKTDNLNKCCKWLF